MHFYETHCETHNQLFEFFKYLKQLRQPFQERNSMIKKIGLFLLAAFSLSFSQLSVNISGIVQDSVTGKPIDNATIKLLGMDLTSVSDANGSFTISSVSVLPSIPTQNPCIIQFLGNEGFFINNRTNENIKICLFDLSGRLNRTIFSGNQQFVKILFSQLSINNGVYVCRITAAKESYSIKFLSCDNKISRINGGNYTADYNFNTTSAKKIAAITAAIDTLLVTKNGYFPAKIPIDNLTKAGLIIRLTDSLSSQNSTIIPDPSWTCYMPNGIPPPEMGVAVFTITMQIGAIHNVGATQYGHRYQYDIKGGTLNGERITGTVLNGGLDYALTLSNGSVELEQIVILRASDNTPILMRNAGVAPSSDKPVRVVLDFEAPNSSSHTWLNTGKFAATRVIDTVAKTMKLDVYDISKVTLPETRIQIKDPTNVPNQTWDCIKLTGSQGASVFTENVTLGSSISIGASKRGSRNIIPITGGTTTGRVVGKILSGGADYQLSGLDARYSVSTNDGEFIIIRNCGSGALVPAFETRADGPYAFLNENKYLSSQPGMTSGGVSITFYEKR